MPDKIIEVPKDDCLMCRFLTTVDGHEGLRHICVLFRQEVLFRPLINNKPSWCKAVRVKIEER